MKITKNSIYIPETVLRLDVAPEDSSYCNANYTFLVNRAPTSGTITVFPTSGSPLLTHFNFTTQGWIDSDLPLNYTYYYTNPNISIEVLYPNTVSSAISTLLPSSPTNQTTVLVTATDVYGAVSNMTSTSVTYRRTLDIKTLLTTIPQIFTTIQNSNNSD